MLRDVLLAAGFAAALGVGVYATDAYPQEAVTFGDGQMVGTTYKPPSRVSMGPPSRAGALADVIFENSSVNDEFDTGDMGKMTFGGITIAVEFGYNVGPMGVDRITIAPPEGITCLPECEITIQEDTKAKVSLFSDHAVGM